MSFKNLILFIAVMCADGFLGIVVQIYLDD